MRKPLSRLLIIQSFGWICGQAFPAHHLFPHPGVSFIRPILFQIIILLPAVSREGGGGGVWTALFGFWFFKRMGREASFFQFFFRIRIEFSFHVFVDLFFSCSFRFLIFFFSFLRPFFFLSSLLSFHPFTFIFLFFILRLSPFITPSPLLSFIYSLTPSLPSSLPSSPTHSLTPSPTHSPIHSLILSLTRA